MADPNAHTHHHLNQQPQLVSGPVPPLLLDPQTQVALAAAPPHLHSQHQFQPQHYSVLDNFWQQQFHEIRHGAHDFKVHQLPLARIKKVMKTDEEVKMISAEAPILFAKGCDIFITELTMRAWHHAEECKRRTLQRSDIANAIKKVDMFDFLIDIVPREDKVSVKTEKMEYQDHQNQYPYGMGMPPSGHPFNTSSNDHKIIMDPIAALHEQQQHLQHMQYMQRMESQHHHQVLHDHSEHQQHQHHQHPPTLLPPLAPVAGQQVPSYRARPQYASVSTDVSAASVRQVTTEQPYQHPHYYNHSQELHHHQQQTPSQHQLHRQPDHNNPVQVKYEFESSVARPVEWYSQPSTQLANNGHNTRGYVQGNSHANHSHGYGQPLSQSHDYNHDSTGVRHEEGYVRGGGVQRN